MDLLALQSFVFSVRGDVPSRPISVSVPSQTVMWVKGRSGAGKTTFLRTVARLLPLLTGDMLLEGVSWSHIPAVEWRTRITYFHQKPVMFSGTVVSNLQRPFSLRNRSGRTLDLERAGELAARLLLPEDVMSRDALTLSVGEASRVALVRGLLTDPQVLLLDEPTAALDPKSGQALAEVLGEWLCVGRRGIIAVAHDRDMIGLLPGEDITLD